MPLDRRQLLVTGGACLASCAAPRLRGDGPTDALDRLLAAHSDKLPERAGAGANHYPMAAEALEALGRADAIDGDWALGGAELYAGEPGRAARIGDDADVVEALGDHGRLGDWLDRFRSDLARDPWPAVVAAWAPRLAPGLAGAGFHGLLRTGHAARALRRRASDARRDELAVGLAYWAARYTELPATADGGAPRAELRATLQGLEHPWLDDPADVGFDALMERLTAAPLAPPVAPAAPGADARAELELVVREAATLFLEMLVAERHRIWLLHTVTGPAAVELLLPHVDPAGARTLAACARQAMVALFAAYGEPYVPRAHVRAAPAPWPDLLGRAAPSGSVHTIKLLEALRRFDDGGGDRLWRSVAEQWLEWT